MSRNLGGYTRLQTCMWVRVRVWMWDKEHESDYTNTNEEGKDTNTGKTKQALSTSAKIYRYTYVRTNYYYPDEYSIYNPQRSPTYPTTYYYLHRA